MVVDFYTVSQESDDIEEIILPHKNQEVNYFDLVEEAVKTIKEDSN